MTNTIYFVGSLDKLPEPLTKEDEIKAVQIIQEGLKKLDRNGINRFYFSTFLKLCIYCNTKIIRCQVKNKKVGVSHFFMNSSYVDSFAEQTLSACICRPVCLLF